MSIYDIIIIGGGPAGLSAAVYAGRAKLKTMIIEKGQIGGQAFSTRELVNYPGFFKGTSGPDVTKAMFEHAEKFGVEIVKGEVVDLTVDEEIKRVETKKGNEYRTKTIILCPGSEPRLLNIKGEKELRGNGVSYCATCDAEFYQDLNVVVVGNGDAAIEEALYITKFAQKVYMIVIHEEGKVDCNRNSAEVAFRNPKIQFVWNSVLAEIKGDYEVEGAIVRNLKTGELTEIEAEGVFVYIGTIPRTQFLQNKVDLKDGYVITNNQMETSSEGVFCAGDARVKYLRQVVTAASDGAVSAVVAERYINEVESFREQVLAINEPVFMLFWNPANDNNFKIVTQIGEICTQNDFRLIKLDISKNDRIPKKYGIDSAPALLLLRKGEVINDFTSLLYTPESSEEITNICKGGWRGLV